MKFLFWLLALSSLFFFGVVLIAVIFPYNLSVILNFVYGYIIGTVAAHILPDLYEEYKHSK